jgi:hypothetical protein
MESMKLMTMFYGGNSRLWKFKMHIMFSKHELWKAFFMGAQPFWMVMMK